MKSQRNCASRRRPHQAGAVSLQVLKSVHEFKSTTGSSEGYLFLLLSARFSIPLPGRRNAFGLSDAALRMHPRGNLVLPSSFANCTPMALRLSARTALVGGHRAAFGNSRCELIFQRSFISFALLPPRLGRRSRGSQRMVLHGMSRRGCDVVQRVHWSLSFRPVSPAVKNYFAIFAGFD